MMPVALYTFTLPLPYYAPFKSSWLRPFKLLTITEVDSKTDTSSITSLITGEPSVMAATAAEYVKNGVRIIKIKLGKNADTDVERARRGHWP